jgi:lysine biosynthesis protein LysW
MAFAYCPDCGVRVDLSRVPKKGQRVTCWCCNAALKVVDLNPLQIDLQAEAINKDWQEDWEVELERLPVSRPEFPKE